MAGNKILKSMGKAWFVSRKYHDLIDSREMRWSKTGQAWREPGYTKEPGKYIEYLEEIMNSNPSLMGNNSIGISSNEIIEMTKALLDKMKTQ